jgi:beta-galactosidase
VIKKHLPATQTLPAVPGNKNTISIPSIQFTKTCSVFDVLPQPKLNSSPLSFETLNQAYGFVLYRTVIDGNKAGVIKIKDLRDYGIIFINGKRIGVLDRRLNEDSMAVDLPKGKVVLDILVENMGRINFGEYLLKNKKGITESVMLNNKELIDWKMYSLPFDNINSVVIKNNKVADAVPVLKKGNFEIKTTGDTYLDMSNWGKGIVWVNGHNLGKYWSIGPQQTLYLPVEWLHEGVNEIIVLDLLNKGSHDLNGLDHAILDQLK